MKLFDSHTHLNADPLFQDWQKHLQFFVDAGGGGLVNSGASDSYNIRGIEIAKAVAQDVKYKDIFVKSTIGYHPGCCDDGEITQENIDQKIIDLRKLYEANKDHIVAIGECGIDTYYPGSDQYLTLQKKLFILQCDLAQELGLPLMVHIRKDFDTALDVLKHYRDMTIYIHCRGFGPKELEMLKLGSIERGWKLFIGFCGNVTYKKADDLRTSLHLISLDQLFLETDAPWLSPQNVRGTTNTPVNVKYIYEFVANTFHMSIEDLSLSIHKNIKNIYNI